MARQVGPYEALAPLMTGGMAELWLGVQVGARGFRKPLVLKLVRPEVLGASTPAEAFLDEAKLGVMLDHPNLARVYDAALDPQTGLPFVALEVLAGVDAQRVLARCEQLNRKVPLSVACRVVRDLCSALHRAHTNKDAKGQPSPIIHRDVAPKNVMLTFDGRAVLIDFGIARAQGRLVHTRPGIVKGTVGYMAPEQIRGEPLDGRSDQFSAAIVLAELVSGRPFSADPEASDEQQRLANGSFELGWVRQLDAPEAVRRIILQGLAPDRGDRFPSCKEFAAALEEACPALGDDAAWKDLLAELFPRTASLFAKALDAVAANDPALVESRLVLWRRSLLEPPDAPTLVGPAPTEPVPERRATTAAQPSHALGWAVGGTLVLVLVLVGAGLLVLRDEPPPPPPPRAEAPQRAEDRELAAAAAYEAAGDLARAMAVLRDCKVGDIPCPRAQTELARLEAKQLAQVPPAPAPAQADDDEPTFLPAPQRPCALGAIDQQIRALDWETAGDGLRACLESPSLKVVRAAQDRLAQLAAAKAERCLFQEAERAVADKRWTDAKWLAAQVPDDSIFRAPKRRLLAKAPKRTRPAGSSETLTAVYGCATKVGNEPNALLHLADAYVASGQRGPALAAYERFLAAAPPTHPALRRVRAFVDRALQAEAASAQRP